MGCGCAGGSGKDRSGSTRIALTKKPGYTWDGPEEEADAEPVPAKPENEA